MVVIETLKSYLELLLSPFQELFTSFPEFANIIRGLLVISLGYFGWRAVK